MNEFEYILTLNSHQAHEILKVVELLERWKLKQPDIMSHMLLDYEEMSIDEYCERRDKLNRALKEAMDIAIPHDPTYTKKLKDDEWYLLYNITQALRYAVHQAEHPNTTGVDSYPPLQLGGQPVPECEWRKKE